MNDHEPGLVIWFTGMAASGKSTVAKEVENRLRALDLPVENFDADDVRANLSPNLGYTEQARDENTKRLAWMAQMLSKYGVNVVVTAVSSLRRYRDRAREYCPRFLEVQVICPVEVCQQRDPKGLYARAARGEINDIAGLHQPYEEAENAEVVLRTNKFSVEACADLVIQKAQELGYLPSQGD